MASSITSYRVVTLTTSARYNFVTGTTATSTGNAVPADKGVEVTFQNQSTGSQNIYVGGSDISISIGATSTLGVAGIQLTPGSAFTIGKRHAPSAINMQDWFVVSTSSSAVAVAQLIKAV